MALIPIEKELEKRSDATPNAWIRAPHIKNIVAKAVDISPILTYIYRMKETNRKKKTMQETITKYQSKFDRLMTSIEKDKILKKMPGNATAGIAVQMIKSLKSYLKANRAWAIN